MYASATPGGIVNIVTADPKLEKYESKGSIEYGSYELLHMEGALNAPITDTMAFRASFSTTDRDGYLSNGAEDEDSKVARLKLKYAPSDDFSIVLTGELEKSGGQGFAGVEMFGDPDEVDDPWYSEDEVPGSPRMTDKKRGYALIVCCLFNINTTMLRIMCE
jgi:iron complex outermembrane receptor protein